MRILEEILFFKATYNTKRNKRIHLSFASWILAEERGHEIDLIFTGLDHLWEVRQSRSLFLPQESNWQKISELFVFVLYVALKKRISSKIRILSCSI